MRLANFAKTQARWRNTTGFKVVHSPVFASAHYFKVFYSVVGSIFVFMMNQFLRRQDSSYIIGHNKSVLRYIPFSVPHWMRRIINLHVSMIVKMSATFPFMAFMAALGNVVISQQWQGQAAKMPLANKSYFGKIRGFTASAFTNTRWYFFRLWKILMPNRLLHTGTVSGDKSRLVIFTSFPRIQDFGSASAFTSFHRVIIAE